MNAFIVYAHPDPTSLTGSLKDVAVDALREQGHEVVVSDLYAMKWKSAADFGDFDDIPGSDFMHASGEAYRTGRLSEDIRAEQQKLLAADLVILHFPLWWFTVPAILKGWMDRVFTRDFAYGPEVPRYGDGPFVGKRAMIVTTAGGPASNYTDRGVNGSTEDLLFPVNHGTLFFTGFDILPPFVAYRAVHLSKEHFAELAEQYRRRLSTAFTAEPIPYRPARSGDYDDTLQLKPGREVPGSTGFRLHTAAR